MTKASIAWLVRSASQTNGLSNAILRHGWLRPLRLPPANTQWYTIRYHFREDAMAITASEARKNLFPLLEKVNEDRTPIEITSKRGDAVLLSIDDYRALEETAYLLRSPANVRRLLESLDQARAGSSEEHELDR